jgi:hypothetical protein
MHTTTHYKHSTNLANRGKRKEAQKHRFIEDDDSRLHCLEPGKPNSECMSVRMARSKRKSRKLSSSSSSSEYAANSKRQEKLKLMLQLWTKLQLQLIQNLKNRRLLNRKTDQLTDGMERHR